MSESFSTPIESLLVHERWARTLAKALVHDDGQAEDLFQQALHAALRRPPAPDIDSKRWLAKVMRNLARFKARSEAHRIEVERRHARPEGDEEAADHALRVLESRGLLQRAVTALAEPYRSVITARYLEGLPPRDIARERRVPIKTVKSQLNRALETLRDRLDRQTGGDRSVWVSALVPLLLPPPGAGIAWMSSKTALVATGIVLCAAVFWTWRAPPSVVDGALSDAQATERPPPISADALDSVSAAPGSPRTAVRSAEVEVHVVHAASREPVAGAEIRSWPLPAVTDIDQQVREWLRAGRLEEETAAASERSSTNERGRAWLRQGVNGFVVTASAGTSWGWTVVKDPRSGPVRVEVQNDGDVRVRVLDAERRPLHGVRVQLRSLGYCGEDNENLEYRYAFTEEPDGIAVLRHVGHVTSSTESACKATAEIHVCVAGGSNLTRTLDRYHLPKTPIDIVLDVAVGTCEVELVDERGSTIREECQVNVDGVPTPFTAIVRDGRLSFPIALDQRVVIATFCKRLRLPFPEVELHGPRSAGGVVRATIRPDAAMCTLTGRLLDAGGRAVPHAEFLYSSSPFDDRIYPPPKTTSHSDEFGRFGITLAPECEEETGYSVIRLCSLGRSGEIVAAASTRVLIDGTAVDLGDVQLDPCPVLVQGLVVDPDGHPVPDAQIVVLEEVWSDLEDLRVRSDKHGRFVVRGREREYKRFSLKVRKPGLATASVDAERGQDDLRIALEQPVVLSGCVLMDPSMAKDCMFVAVTRSGVPLAGLIPEYTMTGQFRDYGVFVHILDGGGSFTLHDVPLGSYTVRLIRHNPWSPTVLYEIDDVRATSHDDCHFQLPPIDVRDKFRYVSVSVCNADGAPVPDATVRLAPNDVGWPWPNDSDNFEDWRCDSRGMCKALVGEQRHTLEVEATGHPVVEAVSNMSDVHVVLPRFPEVDFVLEGGLPVLEPGVQLSAYLSQRHRFQRCYEHGHDFDVEGKLHCPTPQLGPSQVVIRVRAWRESDGCFEEVAVDVNDAKARDVVIRAGEPMTFSLPALDPDALAKAIEALK